LNTKQNENIAEIFVQKFERSIQKVWWGESSVLFMTDEQGRSQTFSFGGSTGGASFATRELSMVCVGLSERDLLQ